MDTGQIITLSVTLLGTGMAIGAGLGAMAVEVFTTRRSRRNGAQS